MEEADVLLLESFYSGPYKQLMDFLSTLPRTCLYTLPPDVSQTFRSTPCRDRGSEDLAVRTSALAFSEMVPESHSFKTLFTSSVLNLCELIALRPDLGKLRTIIYFHDNQVVHPVHKRKNERNFQHGYSEILSCLVAKKVVFNTKHHMETFLKFIDTTYMNAMPLANRPKDLVSVIKPKCSVLYLPIDFYPLESLNVDSAFVGQKTSLLSSDSGTSAASTSSRKLHIVWPYLYHKYSSTPDENEKNRHHQDKTPAHEQDNNPDIFFNTLSRRLKHLTASFRVTILGGGMQPQKPETYDAAERVAEIDDLQFWRTDAAYRQVLHSADIVVSTAREDFSGASVLEAVHAGCKPLCPKYVVHDGTAYPSVFMELLPETCHDACLWTTKRDLYKKLKGFVDDYKKGKFTKGIEMNPTEQFSWDVLRSGYESILYGD